MTFIYLGDSVDALTAQRGIDIVRPQVAALNEELLLWDAHLSDGYAAGKEFTLAGAPCLLFQQLMLPVPPCTCLESLRSC